MPPVLFEKNNFIATITLNRPETHNALDFEMGALLNDIWDEVQNDKSIRCAILTGAGDKSFCSGANLKKATPLFNGSRPPENDFERRILEDGEFRYYPVLRKPRVTKPIVAAINGTAIAGGMEFLYATDIRVANENAKFGLQEVNWAVFPSGGSTVKIPMQFSYARAMEILLTGELISAQQALDWGFLNKITTPDNVMSEAVKYAEKIASNGPLAVQAVKESVLKTHGIALEEALDIEHHICESKVMGTKDSREGPLAFKEKRAPNFIGE